MSQFDELIITSVEDGYWVEAVGEYGQSSVLAGQTFYQKTRHFDIVEEAVEWAKEEFPRHDVEILDNNPSAMLKFAGSQMSDIPPDWFDPLDCGEEW